MSVAALGWLETGHLRQIDVNHILPNPHQPRTVFDEASLRELAASIRNHGVLQPLTVRRLTPRGSYELISGERRLRAARIAGLVTVPCIIVGADEQRSAVLALVENLQREDLDFVEQARGIQELMQTYGMTQEEVARMLGKNQSTIANKLRILKHPPEVLDLLRAGTLTERHARALLGLQTDEERIKAAGTVVEKRLTVAETEALVAKLTEKPKGKKHPPQKYIIKDVRLFLNTVRHAVGVMQKSGVLADLNENEEQDAILLTIRIQK